MKTAFLGSGVMGAPMAGHLVKAGHEVTALFNQFYARLSRNEHGRLETSSLIQLQTDY